MNIWRQLKQSLIENMETIKTVTHENMRDN